MRTDCVLFTFLIVVEPSKGEDETRDGKDGTTVKNTYIYKPGRKNTIQSVIVKCPGSLWYLVQFTLQETYELTVSNCVRLPNDRIL